MRPKVGELFQFKAAARGLRAIAAARGQAFYGGEIAQAIERFSAEHGGSLKASDFAAYQPDWVTPIAQGLPRLHPARDPAQRPGHRRADRAGHPATTSILRALPVDGVDSQHLQIEAMKLAFADVYRYVAEPPSMEVSVEQMLDDAYLASRAKLIDLKKAQDFGAGNPVKGGTIYLTAADENGMMVSFIQSNYMGFGSGCVEPHFGISLQNRGHGFSVDAAANPANLVAPGKRPFHTIIPAFLTKDGQPVMSYGVMGGNMQPQGHMQTLVRMLDYGQNPQAACDAPRWRYNAGLEINVESAMDAQTVQAWRTGATGWKYQRQLPGLRRRTVHLAAGRPGSRATWPPATRAATDRPWLLEPFVRRGGWPCLARPSRCGCCDPWIHPKLAPGLALAVAAPSPSAARPSSSSWPTATAWTRSRC